MQEFHAYFVTLNLLYELFCKPSPLFSVHNLYLVLKYHTFRIGILYGCCEACM